MRVFLALIALVLFLIVVAQGGHDGKTDTSAPAPAEWQIQTEHESCNLANILFGQRRIEISRMGDDETGAILDSNPESPTYNRTLGRISLPILHGERVINDRDGPYCGTILKDNATIYCKPCGRMVGYLKAVSENAFSVVTKGGEIVGSLEGRFPRDALAEMGSAAADTAAATPKCKDRIARLMRATGAKFGDIPQAGKTLFSPRRTTKICTFIAPIRMRFTSRSPL